MNHSVYIGPYLKVPHVELPDDKLTHSCSANCGAQDIRSTMKFCPSCGAPVDARTSGEKVLTAISVHDLPPGADSKLFCPESCSGSKKSPHSVWLSNLREIGKIFGDQDGDQVAELLPDEMADELHKFAYAVRDQVHWLRTTCGIEASAHYGAVSYWN